MKKVLLLIGCLFIGITSANALTLNEDGTYTNTKGVKIASEQYKNLSANFSKRTIDLLNQKQIDGLLNPNDKIQTTTDYTITTDKIVNGEIVDSITIFATESEAKKVAKNDNLHILSDMKLHDISEIPMPLYDSYDVVYETSSKKLSFTFKEFVYGSDFSDVIPTIIMNVEWFKVPMIKKYDILAVRWNKSMPTSNVVSFIGEQSCVDKNGKGLVANYQLGSGNQKITTNGFGQIMNIFDNASSGLELNFVLEFANSIGNTAYGTYQHARNSNITLAQAKSYSIQTGGLGNVVYFSNATVRNYYDAMQGVQVTN